MHDNNIQWFHLSQIPHTGQCVQIPICQVLREIASNLHNTPFYTIMADETTDSSNKEQFVVCFRWVDDELEVHEDFIGLHMVESIDAATLYAVLKDVSIWMNLSVAKLRGPMLQWGKLHVWLEIRSSHMILRRGTESNLHPLLWACPEPCMQWHNQRMQADEGCAWCHSRGSKFK